MWNALSPDIKLSTNVNAFKTGGGLAPLTGVRCCATSTSLARSNFSCPYFLLVFQLAKESVFFIR